MEFMEKDGVCLVLVNHFMHWDKAFEVARSCKSFQAGPNPPNFRPYYIQTNYTYQVSQGDLVFAAIIPHDKRGVSAARVITMHGPTDKIEEELKRFSIYAERKGFVTILSAEYVQAEAASRPSPK